MKIIKYVLQIVLFVLVSIGSVKAQGVDTLKGASPFTAGHYVPGVWNIRDFATPPAGFYILDYNMFITGSKFFNSEGNQVTEIVRSNSTTNLDIDISGYVNVPVLFYSSKFKILGGTYIASFSPPFSTVNSDLAYDAVATILRDTITKTGSVTGNVNGFSDMTFLPFGLSWASEMLNLTVAYSLVAPTGRYTPGGSDNIGLGYWTNMFQAFGYVYPMKMKGKPSQAMAIMTALTYEINSKITDVNVSPGNRLTVEYGISQYLSPRFEVGFMGGNNFQITDDKGSSVWWNASVLDQMGYFGFQMSGWPIENKLYTSLKYNIQYGLKQRLKQDMLMFNITYAPGWLSGN